MASTTEGARRISSFPKLGYTHLINPKLALGVSIYGNGGMNTAYTTPFPLFSGPTNFRAGVDLQQLFMSPTVAFKANAHNAFGVALNIAYQKFSAQGLENFANSRASGIQLCSTTWWSAEERRFSAISRWEAWQSRQSPHPCHDR